MEIEIVFYCKKIEMNYPFIQQVPLFSPPYKMNQYLESFQLKFELLKPNYSPEIFSTKN